ncbi:MAG TPA: substrate-binding domain-containing protein [Xanthobacteraceae bacterium]|nr:substrate-binding domain-containing protein [Xanthobacteraceae bacterium]
MKKFVTGVVAAGVLAIFAATPVRAADLKIALVYSKTGPLEAYAKQTETGLTLGFEYLTGGTMMLDGRKIVVLPKDDQGKPDIAKSLLEQAYSDDGVDLAIGTSSSGATLAMLPVAEDAKKILIVEPAVADSITGDKWNRYIFRTARNSTQDALAAAIALGKGEVSIGMLAQDYSFGRDGVAAFKTALIEAHSRAKVVFEEYAPVATTDFTASAQRLFDALKDRPGLKIIAIIWAGPNPLAKIADLKPERYGIELSPGGNILPVMKQYKQFPGMQGTIYYYYGFPKNAMNDWLVAEHDKRFHMPPDFFTCGGMAAASAVVTAIKKAGGTDTEKLIAAVEGMEFDTPKGKMIFRKEDHQALQSMYVWKVKAGGTSDWDLLDLVREIPIAELPVPIRNKR